MGRVVAGLAILTYTLAKEPARSNAEPTDVNKKADLEERLNDQAADNKVSDDVDTA